MTLSDTSESICPTRTRTRSYAAESEAWSFPITRSSGPTSSDDRDRELPRVHEHQPERPEDLDDGDDPGDPAPLGELAQRVDVGRDARDEHAPPLARLRRDGQVVDVLEPRHAQALEGRLGRADEPPRRGAAGEVGADDDEQREPAEAEDEPGSEPAVEAVVEDLLDEDRWQQPGDRGRERHDHGEAEPGAELRAHPQAPHEHAPRALEVGGDREVLVVTGTLLGGHLDRGRAHRAARSPRS